MPRIHLVTDITAPPDVSFDVARDVAVHLASSPSERVVAGVDEGLLQIDDEVTWSARHFGIRWRMTSKIVEYERPHRFADQMQHGPFARWRHQHTFEATGTGTRMVDDVDYASPFGLFGRAVDTLVLDGYMTRLLRRHNQHVRTVAEKREPAIAAGPRPDAACAESTRRRWRICGVGQATIRRDPASVLAFVLDVDQYRRADHKIGRIHHLWRDGNRGEVRHGGRFLGLPTPAATLGFELRSASRLDFWGVAMPWPLRAFDGSFTCEVGPDGTHVVHQECFTFGPVSGRIFRTLFAGWLARDTQAEVIRMKQLLETGEVA